MTPNLLKPLLVFMAAILLVACDPLTAPTPTPQQDVPTALAANPPHVWIDNPLPGQALTIDELPPQLVAHASALGGGAQLEICDDNGNIITLMGLGEAVDTLTQGGQLSRYQGEWVTLLRALLESTEGNLTLKLSVIVGGVASDPIRFTLLQATSTPTLTPSTTPTPTDTYTPTPTFTPTDSPTMTPTATNTPTLTNTPTNTPTFTFTPSVTLTPSFTPTNTLSPTPTYTYTPSPTIDIGFHDKEQLTCYLQAVRGRDVAARVGPGEHRGAIAYMPSDKRYEVLGKNDEMGELWWVFDFTDYNREAWVKGADVYTEGSCLIVHNEEAPVYIPRPVEPVVPDVPDVPDVPWGEPVIHFFYADHTSLPYQSASGLEYCTMLHWGVEFVEGVYLDGQGVVGNDTRQTCMPQQGTTLTHTLTIHSGGQAVDSQTVTITFNPSGGGGGTGPQPRIVSFTASPNPAQSGSTVTVSWQTANAQRVEYHNGNQWSTVNASGSRTFSISQNVTLRLRVFDAQNQVIDSRSLTVTVGQPAQRPRIVNFTANPNPATLFDSSGAGVTVAWQTADATRVEFFNGSSWSNVNASGNTVLSLFSNTTVRLRVYNAQNQVAGEQSIPIQIIRPAPPARIVSFTAYPNPAGLRAFVTVTWQTSDASRVEYFDGSSWSTVEATGGRTFIMGFSNVTLQLRVYNAQNQITDQASIVVRYATPTPSISSFTVSRTSAWCGLDVTANWYVSNPARVELVDCTNLTCATVYNQYNQSSGSYTLTMVDRDRTLYLYAYDSSGTRVDSEVRTITYSGCIR